MKLSARFWAQVEKTETCWLWRGGLNANGYGTFNRFNRRQGTTLAHRLAYQEIIGEIPGGLGLDHLCRVRNCVNPAHLEPVTQRENVLRGAVATKTHCKNGHILDGRNGQGRRYCLTCNRERVAAYKARQRADKPWSARVS